MAAKKKKSKAGKKSVKSPKTAKKKRPASKSTSKKPKTENYNIRVLYDDDAKTVSVLDSHVTIHKHETLVKWVAASWSDPFTFTLDPALKCPFGTPTLASGDTVIKLQYHGKGSDGDLDFIYELSVKPGSEVEMANGRLLGGSTIKNH